jgi:hypothetical protein
MSPTGKVCLLSLTMVLGACASISVESLPWEPSHSNLDTSDDIRMVNDHTDADLDAADLDDAEVVDVPDDTASSADAGTDSSPMEGGAEDANVIRTDAGMTNGGGSDAGSASGGSDAGASNPSEAGTTACDGRRVFGLCWYLGPTGANCNETCLRNGGFDTRTVDYVGTSNQGGSLNECTQILRALGVTETVGEGKRSDSLGLGCHLWTDGAPWWLEDPSERFGPTEDFLGVRIACACQR